MGGDGSAAQRVELEAICEEFRKDYKPPSLSFRNAEFDWPADKLDPATRKVFVEFLESRAARRNSSGSCSYKNSAAAFKEKTPCWRMLAHQWPAM